MSSLQSLDIFNKSYQNYFHHVDIKYFLDKKFNDTRETSSYVSTRQTVINKNDNDHKNYSNYNMFLITDEVYKTFSNYTFYLPRNMRKIYIHDNLLRLSIRRYPFAPNNRLTHIFVQNSILYELIGPITGLLKLQYLDLSGNFCNDITSTFFQHFPSLLFLNLSNNLLSRTFQWDDKCELFMNLRQLSNLDLSWNRIAHLS